MKYSAMTVVLALLTLTATAVAHQKPEKRKVDAAHLNTITMPEAADNIHVVPVSSDDLASGFVIFVRQRVAPHFHQDHTELLYVLQGKARMMLGDQQLLLDVTSETPLKVLSVQTPRFDGKDRHFVRQPD